MLFTRKDLKFIKFERSELLKSTNTNIFRHTNAGNVELFRDALKKENEQYLNDIDKKFNVFIQMYWRFFGMKHIGFTDFGVYHFNAFVIQVFREICSKEYKNDYLIQLLYNFETNDRFPIFLAKKMYRQRLASGEQKHILSTLLASHWSLVLLFLHLNNEIKPNEFDLNCVTEYPTLMMRKLRFKRPMFYDILIKACCLVSKEIVRKQNVLKRRINVSTILGVNRQFSCYTTINNVRDKTSVDNDIFVHPWHKEDDPKITFYDEEMEYKNNLSSDYVDDDVTTSIKKLLDRFIVFENVNCSMTRHKDTRTVEELKNYVIVSTKDSLDFVFVSRNDKGEIKSIVKRIIPPFHFLYYFNQSKNKLCEIKSLTNQGFFFILAIESTKSLLNPKFNTIPTSIDIIQNYDLTNEEVKPQANSNSSKLINVVDEPKPKKYIFILLGLCYVTAEYAAVSKEKKKSDTTSQPYRDWVRIKELEKLYPEAFIITISKNTYAETFAEKGHHVDSWFGKNTAGDFSKLNNKLPIRYILGEYLRVTSAYGQQMYEYVRIMLMVFRTLLTKETQIILPNYPVSGWNKGEGKDIDNSFNTVFKVEKFDDERQNPLCQATLSVEKQKPEERAYHFDAIKSFEDAVKESTLKSAFVLITMK